MLNILFFCKLFLSFHKIKNIQNSYRYVQFGTFFLVLVKYLEIFMLYFYNLLINRFQDTLAEFNELLPSTIYENCLIFGYFGEALLSLPLYKITG